MPKKAVKKTTQETSPSTAAPLSEITPSKSKFIVVDHSEDNVSYIRAEYVVSLHKRFEEMACGMQVEMTEILLIDGRKVIAHQPMSGIVKALENCM